MSSPLAAVHRLLRGATCFVGCGLLLLVNVSHAGEAPLREQAEQGRYLAIAGNCISCHTRPGGEPFAGGLPFETPLGVIYSSNITPDADTGIGSWSAADIQSALKKGIGKEGKRLFPAFPYPSFAKITDADAEAIAAYLKTLKAVKYEPPTNGWVFRMRWSMGPWNSMNFEVGTYAKDPKQSDEWNRGAYLVQGLGHCSACHSPRNWMMAEESDHTLMGGSLQSEVLPGKSGRWSAPNLTSAKSGLVAWSVNDLAKYLQTGFSARAGSFGPMNEVIINSLSKLAKADVQAMAVYLKSLQASETPGVSLVPEQIRPGEATYKARCEKCHGGSGRGGMFSAPPVAGSAIVQAEDPASLINVILYGPQLHKDIATGSWESMPAYRDVLSDGQIASLSNYLRGSFGNRGSLVEENAVTKLRQ